MADLTYTHTVDQVQPAFPAPTGDMVTQNYEIGISSTLDVGDVVYLAADGTLTASDASLAASAIAYGVIISKRGRGVTVLRRGTLEGYDVSGSDCGDEIYISDTAGALSDTVGTVTKQVGVVTAIAFHGSIKKAVYFAPENY